MRIAIVNSNRTLIGGIETYLRWVVPALTAQGHDVAFWHEVAETMEREEIPLPVGTLTWSVAVLGTNRALDALRQWQPDVIYAHGLRSPDLETAIQKLAPTVFFAHAYYGSCVSGEKCFKFPAAQPCDRSFGWKCLAHYYPNRCGGLNPVTMMREYGLQKQRLSLLPDYAAIIVASSHMCREYRKYGLSDQLHVVPVPIAPIELKKPSGNIHQREERWHLLFLGRMESLKGGAVLLEALPSVARSIANPLRATFAGDGRARIEWERRAALISADHPNLEITFTGWLDETRRSEVLSACDLIVVPSLWPEPFGLVGLEAGLHGVPAVAFAVGGIPDWLKDGVNGVLAKGTPPSSAELSIAILRCLCDSDFYIKLRHGAKEQAMKFDMKKHLANLLPILTRTAQGHVTKSRLLTNSN